MLALFFGLRPDHLTDSSRPRKRRLIRAPGCRSLNVLSPPGAGRARGAQGYRRASARLARQISTTAGSAGS